MDQEKLNAMFAAQMDGTIKAIMADGEDVPDVIRPDDSQFSGLDDYPFAPNYVEWSGLRMHYVDEGPKDGPIALLVHGQPTWSYLYRRMITKLVAAGYRCIAPDYIGCGKSDKKTDDTWYTYERHCESITHLIETLDLNEITLFCQDWGGPIGLRQAVDLEPHFARVVILNTWLHHEGFDYQPPIRLWRQAIFSPFWRIWMKGDFPVDAMMAFALNNQHVEIGKVLAAYAAPYPDRHTKASVRRFPSMLPYVEPEIGGAEAQARCFEALKSYTKPVHFIFGDGDLIFTAMWGKTWSEMVPGATFDTVSGGHFVQEDAGEAIVEAFLKRVG